jgi:hypothetical protein
VRSVPDAAFSVANAQGYLLTVFLQEVGRKIAQSEEAPDLDSETLWADVLSSSFTEQDDAFQDEWQKIQEARRTHKYQDGTIGYQENYDEGVDLGFRFRELRAMVRSACRKGILTRYESPTIEEWKPKVKVTK